MTDANGRTIRTMDGVFQAIQSNVYDRRERSPRRRLWDAVEPIFASGSPLKIMFAGSIVVKQVNTMFKDQIRNVQGETAFGMNARRIITPFGDLDMVFDRALNGPYSGTRLSSTRRREDQEAPPDRGQDGRPGQRGHRAEEIIGELSLAYGVESHHGRIENVQAA